MATMTKEKMREEILKANPGLMMTFSSEMNDWVMVNPFKNSINLINALGTYTLTPSGTLPETEGVPNMKQIVINGNRICFVVKKA